MRPNDVGARRVDGFQAELDRALLYLRRDAVGGEDDRPFFDLVQPGQPVGLIDELDALGLQVVGGVGVVDEHAEHVHRPLCLFPHPFGDPERVNDAVAVPTRRDLQDLHRTPSLREIIWTTMAVAAVESARFDRAELAREARVTRSAALVVDLVVFGFISFVVNNVYGVEQVTSGFITAGGGVISTTTAIDWPWMTLLGVLYFAVPEAIFGASPGKQLMRLKVVRLDGRPLGLGSVIVRNLLKPVDFLPVLYLLGGVLVLAT